MQFVSYSNQWRKYQDDFCRSFAVGLLWMGALCLPLKSILSAHIC